jgi:SAM-dependent methyltransferase
MVEQRRVLHVGSGPKKAEKLHKSFHSLEWTEVRLDIDPKVAPNIVGSIVGMTAVETGSFDAVWSSHNLEHLESYEVPLALKEFRRVLKPTGHLLINLPDLQSIAKLVVEDKLLEPAYVAPAGPICPIDMLFGFRKAIAAGNHFMAHRTGFTAKTLGQAIVQAGFAVARVKRGDHFDLWAIAHVTQPATEADPTPAPT